VTEKLTEKNFVIHAAKHYDASSCHSTEEFYEDLKRYKYIKRLFLRYRDENQLRERLILNHIIILYNMFGKENTRMLFLKLHDFQSYLKPFLVLLNRMPYSIDNIGENDITYYSSDIEMDSNIVDILRKNIR